MKDNLGSLKLQLKQNQDRKNFLCIASIEEEQLAITSLAPILFIVLRGTKRVE